MIEFALSKERLVLGFSTGEGAAPSLESLSESSESDENRMCFFDRTGVFKEKGGMRRPFTSLELPSNVSERNSFVSSSDSEEASEESSVLDDSSASFSFNAEICVEDDGVDNIWTGTFGTVETGAAGLVDATKFNFCFKSRNVIGGVLSGQRWTIIDSFVSFHGVLGVKCEGESDERTEGTASGCERILKGSELYAACD